jgi:hypothetical protein
MLQRTKGWELFLIWSEIEIKLINLYLDARSKVNKFRMSPILCNNGDVRPEEMACITICYSYIKYFTTFPLTGGL